MVFSMSSCFRIFSKVEVRMLGWLFCENIFVINNSSDITEADLHEFDLWFWHLCFILFSSLFCPSSESQDFFVGDFSNLFLGHYWKVWIELPVTFCFKQMVMFSKPFCRTVWEYFLGLITFYLWLSTIWAQTFSYWDLCLCKFLFSCLVLLLSSDMLTDLYFSPFQLLFWQLNNFFKFL